MLNVLPKATHVRPDQRWSRRALLKTSALTPLAGVLSSQRVLANSDLSRATAKKLIYIFLCGGPSQLEMWDPKPSAPEEIRGPFGSIATNVPGVRFGALLPSVAKHADKLAVIRSMTHDSNVHDIGIMYTLLSDSNPPTKIAYPPDRKDHPGLGAILHRLRGDQPDLPAWVTVPRPFTTGKRFYKGQSAGFLGPSYDPYFLDEEKKNSLADKRFRPPALQLRSDLDSTRLAQRRDLQRRLNGHADLKSSSTRQFAEYYEKAYSLLAGSEANSAFDVAREPEALRERYGRNEYGQSFLLARRLVEAGVPAVNVFWTFFGKDGCQFNLWDNHGSDKQVCGGFNKGVDMLKAPYCCPAFDKAFSALLEDLAQRGMLEDTLVVVTGEFGRTPKMNKHAGRDHWAPCYSSVLAGGGVRGGTIYGASDAHAAYVQNSPVRPEDLGATVLHAFGISAETAIYDAANRPVRASKGRAVTEIFA